MTNGSDFGGSAVYTCPNCDHQWTRTWPLEARVPANVREQQIRDPSRFADGDADAEGRYVYADDPDWAERGPYRYFDEDPGPIW
ncbi:hypothetical protein [Streptacidiphilus cavernicola]|uniref:Uncharacterized protein n=1 Tax=Streptacidiphilus cavernicola TaxID=3342716 RepID=A0ABV6VXB3_9ACTN